MRFRYINLQNDGIIATLTLNRPPRLNAICMDMMDEMAAALREVDEDENARVLILTGAGRGFCSGGDFKDGPRTPASLAAQEHVDPTWLAEQTFRDVMSVIGRLQKLRLPTIAAVNGVAVGAGFSIAQACDMRIGSEQTRFAVAWIRRGVVPAFGDTWMLPRIVGLAKAAELIFSGRMIEAKEALNFGLLNKLVPHEKLLEETMSLAKLIADGPPLALRLSKYNLYEGLNLDLEAAVRLLAMGLGMLYQTEDFHEAARAFIQKREPVFKGK